MSYGSELEDSRECEAMRKMFVGGLNRETTEESFFDYFGQFGTMVDKVIIKDPQTKLSRGFGFITYDQSDCVENVFQSRPHELDGKQLDVKRAMPRDYNTTTAHAKVTKLFIGGVGPELTPEDLQSYIESRHSTDFGTVDKIDFLKEKDTNRNKGFGFLECSSNDFADRLTISENSFTLNGKSMSLKKAEPKQSDGGQGGQGPRGRGRGRGGGVRGRGGNRGNYNNGYNQGGYNQQQSYNNYSTGYPAYNANPYGQQQQQQQPQQGYGNYNQQPNGGYGNNQSGYGTTQAAYGANQYGNTQAGYSTGTYGNSRYQPY